MPFSPCMSAAIWDELDYLCSLSKNASLLSCLISASPKQICLIPVGFSNYHKCHPEPLSSWWGEFLKKNPIFRTKSTFLSISVSQSVEVCPSPQINMSVTGWRIWLCAPPFHAIVVCCHHPHEAYTEDWFQILFFMASSSQTQRSFNLGGFVFNFSESNAL